MMISVTEMLGGMRSIDVPVAANGFTGDIVKCREVLVPEVAVDRKACVGEMSVIDDVNLDQNDLLIEINVLYGVNVLSGLAKKCALC